ncbi:retrovirus-related pol polyprotein from transposon TNT 1-94 [Tanacetum coccineum]
MNKMSIGHDRPHRNAKAPSRFGFEDYVAYALQVAKEVESLKPATYREVITSKESHMRSKEDYVCKLLKSLQDLKESPRQWPDIAHAMSVVSRYMAHPRKEHSNAVKRIFCYLKGTSDDLGLIYGGEREFLVTEYVGG